MKLRLSLILSLMIVLAACGSPSPTAPTAAPVTQPISVSPTQPQPTIAPPTGAAVPAATKPPVAPTTTSASPLTKTATAAPATNQSRPTPTSAGPLAAAVYVANCRSAPTADKPGGVIVQISVEASGGNGRYRYFFQDKEWPTKFIDVIGEKGTRLINEVKVTSGDGQEIKKEFDIAVGQLTCP